MILLLVGHMQVGGRLEHIISGKPMVPSPHPPFQLGCDQEWDPFPLSPMGDCYLDWEEMLDPCVTAPDHCGEKDALLPEDGGVLYEALFGQPFGTVCTTTATCCTDDDVDVLSPQNLQDGSVRDNSAGGAESGWEDYGVMGFANQSEVKGRLDSEAGLASDSGHCLFGMESFFASGRSDGGRSDVGLGVNGSATRRLDASRKRKSKTTICDDVRCESRDRRPRQKTSFLVEDPSLTDTAPVVDDGGVVGKRISKSSVAVLTRWLLQNKQNPYPTLAAKKQLGRAAGLSSVQVSNWMTNMRKRHVLPVLRGHKNPKTDLHFGFLEAVNDGAS